MRASFSCPCGVEVTAEGNWKEDQSADLAQRCSDCGEEFIITLSSLGKASPGIIHDGGSQTTETTDASGPSTVVPKAFQYLKQTIILFSKEGMPIDSNPATERLLGYSSGELEHISLGDLVAPGSDLDQASVQNYITKAAGGEQQTFEWQIQRSNGEPRWVLVTASPITLDGVQHVLGEFQDLTELKARGRRLQLLYRVLRHNLRNDMNIIQGNADLLQQTIEDDDLEPLIETIKETANSVGELSETIEELEQLIENDATERQRMNVSKVIQAIVANLQNEHPRATIEAIITEDMYVSADEGLRLALNHAIINAIEHNDTDHPHVTISLEATEQVAYINIADNGPGIPEMEIAAFENETTPLKHGTGLGLSAIRWCIRSLGGTITIDTGEDAGTTLTIELPRIK